MCTLSDVQNYLKIYENIFYSFSVKCLGSPAMESLVNAGAVLAQMPLTNDNDNNIVTEVKPSHFDLAISRLQSKVDEVVDGVWMELTDKVF